MKTKSLFLKLLCVILCLFSLVLLSACGGSGESDNASGKPSVGLAYKSNGDGTCYVSGIGSCSDTNIVIPEKSPTGDVVTGIGTRAFYNLSGIKSVTLSKDVTYVGSNAFAGCTSLTSAYIGDGVTDIGSAAFYGCTRLLKVYVGKSVASIDSDAFYNCTALAGVHIGDISSWCSVSFDTYYSNPLYYAHAVYVDNQRLTSLVIPEGVETISKDAFINCNSISSVSFPASIKHIETDAFAGCTSLDTVDISDIAGWCALTFETELSNPLHYASELMLDGESLSVLVIPDGVTSIGANAFRNCSGIEKVVIPASVTRVGANAFRDCSGLEAVQISDIAAWCAVEFNGHYSNPINCANKIYLGEEQIVDLVIPDGVESIGNYAFYYCDGLRSVVIPDSVKEIGTWAFGGSEQLTAVTIGDGVEVVESYSFAYCTALQNVVIGSGVNVINSYAFDGCISLASVSFAKCENWWYSTSSTATEGIKISEAIISDPLTAAEYLYRYARTYWRHG